MKCDRCGKDSMVTIMSRFNTDILCMGCDAKEHKHPDYEYAREKELEEVRNGNMNFAGVGWPGENGRVPGRETEETP